MRQRLSAKPSMRIFGKYARTGRQVNRIAIVITNMAGTPEMQRLRASAHSQIVDITRDSHNLHPHFTLALLHQAHTGRHGGSLFPEVGIAPADFVYWIPRDSSSIEFRTRGDTDAVIEKQGERHGQQSSYVLPSLPTPRFGSNDRTVQRDPPPMTSPGLRRVDSAGL